MRTTTRRLIQGLCALLVVGGLTPATTATADGGERPAAQNPAADWRVDLASTSADQHNTRHQADGRLTIGDRRARPASAPGRAYALYTAPAQSLGRQTDSFTVRREARVPSGSQVLTEVRGSGHPGDWTQWTAPDSAGRLRLSQAVSVLQVRLTLLGGGTGSPVVSDVRVHADPSRSAARAGAGASAAASVSYRLFATREGLTGQTTANGHVIQPRDHFVALPSRRMLASNGGREYQVRLCYARTGRCETAPVWDVGPWNTKDDYWNPPGQRQMWNDLPQGTPEAQAAYQNGYNGGRDEFGRRVANPAGIDVADGTFWDGLGMTDNDWVDVTFQPTDGGGGGGTTNVTAWAEANVRACAGITGCDPVSKVYPNETYPANCWKTGERISAEGYTSDKWVELPLRAGGVGYVSAIYLKGDETGGVSRRCGT
ncbi:SH3 domain-containing protein [Streptomyces sp. SID13726]|uniref:SH3 domain-containing protein n=1 Tax=Streptomyces sp. SID13726 TaxID=2706058 RepID=UPI0013B86DD4|nr:SH3 domain-containing protein [Streptomyces sp. SID13726]